MKFGYMLDGPSYEPHFLQADSFAGAIEQLESKFDVVRMARRRPDTPFVELWVDNGVERKDMTFEDLKQVYKLYPDLSGFFKCQDLCLHLWDDLWQFDNYIDSHGILSADHAGFTAGTCLSDISKWLDDHTSHGIQSLIVGVPNSLREMEHSEVNVSNESAFSGNQYEIDDNWLHTGQKVKILNQYFEGQIGVIQSYMWNTGNYIVTMPNGHNLPFWPNELEKIQEKKISLNEQIQSASSRAAEASSCVNVLVKESIPEH